MDKAIEAEIVKHAMDPQHYGELKDADGVGAGVDTSGVFVLFYIKVDGETVSDASYATSGSQDVMTMASILSEMVIGDSVSGAWQSLEGLEADVEALYREKEARIEAMIAAGSKAKISLKEQDNAAVVLAAFRAALTHRERRLEGVEEEQYRITIAKRGGKHAKKGCSH